jgi:hypothetical protein
LDGVVCITLLPTVGNTSIQDNRLIDRVLQRVATRLPSGWRPRTSVSTAVRGKHNTVLTIVGPAKASGSMLITPKKRLEPKDVADLVATARPTADRPILIVAPFLSPRTQERLKAGGFAYADLTGNVRLSLSKPGLFLEATGALENPDPAARNRKSLRGAKAGRLVRALADFRPPLGLRELAKHAGVDAGYASRVVDFLKREALVTRTARGPITETDWPALLRRWSQEYSPFQRKGVTWYLAPRGLASVAERLKTASSRYAVSGSWAATQFAPVAPARLLLCYTDDAEGMTRELDLRPTDAGANVALVTPFDPVVYERTSPTKGITVAALSQIAVDLLTSPGRGPNEGEALIEWMRDNEHAWRT